LRSSTSASATCANGTGTDPSSANGLSWLEEAAKDPALPFARYQLGSLLFRASADPAQRRRGFELIRAAADPPLSIPEAQYDFAYAHAFGRENDIVPIDYAKAREYYNCAARNGIDGAYIDLATMDLEGRGAARDIPNALRTLEQAAVKRMPVALCNLGDIYAGPKYGLEDQNRALEYYTRAAELPDPFGALTLAVFLRKKALAVRNVHGTGGKGREYGRNDKLRKVPPRRNRRSGKRAGGKKIPHTRSGAGIQRRTRPPRRYMGRGKGWNSTRRRTGKAALAGRSRRR
jgi:TPR repeat protein